MQLLKFFACAQAMASLARYSQTRLCAPESVMEHTGFVALACYLLTQELNSVVVHETDYLHLGTVLARAVVHDMDEIATGDIPRPTKYANKESIALFTKLKITAITKVVSELVTPVDVNKQILEDHALAKHGREGFIVELVDKMAVVYKIWDELLVRGNHTMCKQAIHLKKFLYSLEAHVASHGFNQEQRYYLLSLIHDMQRILTEAAARDHSMFATLHEDFNNHENNQAG
jgi:5'-deoxynucleotidase YfbR-like HD superfamily hydrolase